MGSGDMNHLVLLQGVADDDLRSVREKEATYRGSWKKRGGVGAWMMLARKWDRLENMMASDHGQDILCACAKETSGADGTALAEVRDLRRYLLLVEAEVLANAMPGAPLSGPAIPPYVTGVQLRSEQLGEADGFVGFVGAPQNDATAMVVDELLRQLDALLPRLQSETARLELLQRADPEARAQWLASSALLRRLERATVPQVARGL